MSETHWAPEKEPTYVEEQKPANGESMKPVNGESYRSRWMPKPVNGAPPLKTAGQAPDEVAAVS